MSDVSAMENRKLQELTDTLSKQPGHFNKTEIKCLIREFNELLGKMSILGRPSIQGFDRERFKRILCSNFGIKDSIMMDEVFRTFDKDNDDFVTVKEWIEGLSVFLRGTLDEKIKYCFHVYDMNSDNYISREEMLRMLKDGLPGLPTREEREEGIKELVEITLKRMDHDHDGRLSLEDFEKSVKEENLLLEAFGKCLPEYKTIEKFEQDVFQKQVEQ
ncbi:calaxin [Parambassis ranga]|uniref:Calaxin n=1 Tax=Parambassis ranga TaxID=210632 RepID=A0A6P7HMU5_9TELE|nr:EF-hand calcium-binding domain-containing protein 1 [Parambassis ranga]